MKKLFIISFLLLVGSYGFGQDQTKLDSVDLLFTGKVFLIKKITASGDTIFDKSDKKIKLSIVRHNMAYIRYNESKEIIYQDSTKKHYIKLNTYHNFYFECSGYRDKTLQIDTYNIPDKYVYKKDGNLGFEYPYEIYLLKKSIPQEKLRINAVIYYNAETELFDAKKKENTIINNNGKTKTIYNVK